MDFHFFIEIGLTIALALISYLTKRGDGAQQKVIRFPSGAEGPRHLYRGAGQYARVEPLDRPGSAEREIKAIQNSTIIELGAL